MNQSAEAGPIIDWEHERCAEHNRLSEGIMLKINTNSSLTEGEIDWMHQNDQELSFYYDRFQGIKAWNKYIAENGDVSDCCGEPIFKGVCSYCDDEAKAMSAVELYDSCGECER